MMPLLVLKRTYDQTKMKDGASLVLMNGLDKRLERDCHGCDCVLLQSSQMDHGRGVAKPGGVEQVSPAF